MFAFGGIDPVAALVPAAGSIALAALCRPAILQHRRSREMDAFLLLAFAASLLQLAPLPRGVLAVVSPASLRVEAAFSLAEPSHRVRPLTVDVRDSTQAVMLLGFVFLLFFTAREIFERGGTRAVARLIAITGLVLAAIALAQNATGRGLMYWRFAPGREGPEPFGPFINRNHFATWAMMAVPLCFGYLAAHVAAHPHRATDWRTRVVGVLDGRAWMLAAASVLLIVATAASLSRSGIVGLTAGIAGIVLVIRQTEVPPGTRASRAILYVPVLAAAVTLGILSQAGAGALAGRFGASGAALADRLAIWHDTLSVLNDFWATGTGVGSFQTAMAVYQRSRPEVIFNQAHNHYLQVAAEGGLLVGVPLLLAGAAFVRAAWTSIHADRSALRYLRCGAACGLAGVALQSVWETGLTMPANAALAAVLAAMIVHGPRGTAD